MNWKIVSVALVVLLVFSIVVIVSLEYRNRKQEVKNDRCLWVLYSYTLEGLTIAQNDLLMLYNPLINKKERWDTLTKEKLLCE